MRLGINGRFLAARTAGVQRFAIEVLKRLISRPGVVLFLPRGVTMSPGVPAPERICRGILGGALWEQLELPARTRHERVDVLLNPANSAPFVGGPHVVVLHDLIPLIRPQDFTLAYRAWVRIAHVGAARRAAAVVTVSRWSADEIARLAGIDRASLSVINQGAAPLDAPASREEVADIRARLGLRGTYFLAVGGRDPRKGAGFLGEMWELWKEDPRPELVVVGEGSGSVFRPDRSENTGQGVRRLGHVLDSDLRALYTGAIALLHPSSAEGFGRPPLEALACGTRVLAAPYGPATSTLGAAADLVPLELSAWHEHAARLLVEPDAERARRIELGRAWAAKFDWDGTVDALWSVCAAHARGGA